MLHYGLPVEGPLVPKHAGSGGGEVGLLLTKELGAHLGTQQKAPVGWVSTKGASGHVAANGMRDMQRLTASTREAAKLHIQCVTDML